MKVRSLLKKIIIISIVFIFLIVIAIVLGYTGMRLSNKSAPPEGISEEKMVDINGSKQWISIYGTDKSNPVLLYLHGGPGGSSSLFDYAVTRKWTDVYTVVTWDQRNCGKSYSKDQNNIKLTHDLFMQDGKEMTEFLLKYLNKDKITLLGYSWGTALGANLVLAYPKYYDTYIGTGQLVDFTAGEEALKEEAKKWTKDNEEGKKLLNQLTVGNYTKEYFDARNGLLKKYNYNDFSSSGKDYNFFLASIGNPYYSFSEYYNYNEVQAEWLDYYNEFSMSDEFVKKFSIANITTYEVPYYNVLGDKDYKTNHNIAKQYFESVKAPRKKLYMMENMTHGLLLSRSSEFSEILHDIYRNEYLSFTSSVPENTTTTNN